MSWIFNGLKKQWQSRRYKNLAIGQIKRYILKIPKAELDFWLSQGWIETVGFSDIHYRAETHETYVASAPKTLLEINQETLIGNVIIGYGSYYGSYGMGGPGFFGLTLDDSTGNYQPSGGKDVLVFAVWGAGQYTLIDNRVVNCSPQYNQNYHPWVSEWADADIEQWDDLTPILIGCKISAIEIGENQCVLTLTKENSPHTIEFLRNDPRLPPMGNGQPRYDAFKTETIGDYLIFQKENAVLYLF